MASPLNSREYLGQGRISAKKSQEARFYEFLKGEPCTASMVTEALKIPQKSLTRAKRKFEKQGILWQVKRTKCKCTNHLAWYLTTDPNKAPKDCIQLGLFDTSNESEAKNDHHLASDRQTPLLSPIEEKKFHSLPLAKDQTKPILLRP